MVTDRLLTVVWKSVLDSAPTYSARGLLETATGGYKYYEALWGAAILYANFCVNAAPFSDG